MSQAGPAAGARETTPGRGARHAATRIDLVACPALIGMHLAGLAVFWTGVSPVAIGIAVALFVVRGFGISAGYHRLLSHRSFRTSRGLQLCFAAIGASAAQLGPLWWAGHHRRHHRESDGPGDLHSPVQGGFFFAHIGWLLTNSASRTAIEEVPDLARFAELRWLDRWHWIPTLVTAAACFALGAVLEQQAPALGTSGAQMLVVGFLWSTLAMYHATYAVNSFGHTIGWRRYETGDQSRNNPLVALVTLGEGWQNNHHRFPAAARSGIFWWEFDPTWWLLRGLAALGLVWDVRPVPAEAYSERLRPLRPYQSAPASTATQTKPNASPTRP